MATLKLYTPLGETLGYFGYKTYHDSWEDGHYWTKCGYPGAVASGQRPSRITWFPIVDDDNDADLDWYEVDWDVETRLELLGGLVLADSSGTPNRGDPNEELLVSGSLTYYDSANHPHSDAIDIYMKTRQYLSISGMWRTMIHLVGPSQVLFQLRTQWGSTPTLSLLYLKELVMMHLLSFPEQHQNPIL